MNGQKSTNAVYGFVVCVFFVSYGVQQNGPRCKIQNEGRLEMRIAGCKQQSSARKRGMR
jgi:hypothetical protein